MGTIVEISGIGLASMVVLTDNPLYPSFHADLRLCTGGFVIERMDKSPLPLLISFKSHVETMWTVDMGEAFHLASRLVDNVSDSSSASSSDSLDGLIVILKLKTHFAVDSDSDISGFESCIQYELWNKIFPSLFPSQYIALMIPSNSRAVAPFNSAHRSWRDFARLYDIPDLRGVRDHSYPIPEAILLSYLIALNSQSLTVVDGDSLQDNLIDPFATDEISSTLLRGYFLPR
jgi:hypothetical protein